MVHLKVSKSSLSNYWWMPLVSKPKPEVWSFISLHSWMIWPASYRSYFSNFSFQVLSSTKSPLPINSTTFSFCEWTNRSRYCSKLRPIISKFALWTRLMIYISSYPLKKTFFSASSLSILQEFLIMITYALLKPLLIVSNNLSLSIPS